MSRAWRGIRNSVVIRGVRVAGLLALLVCALPGATNAQNAMDEARRLAAGGDTAQALQVLQRHLERRSRDADAWHLVGTLAWARTRDTRRAEAMAPEMARLRLLADSSLRLAAQLAKNNGHYWYDLARYALNTGNSFVRMQVPAHLKRAADAARSADNHTLLSKILDEKGMYSWRLYTSLAHRAIKGTKPDLPPNWAGNVPGRPQAPFEPGEIPISVRRDHWAEYFRYFLQPVMPPLGAGDFRNAVESFELALLSDSNNALAQRHLIMTHAHANRWPDVSQEAHRAIRRYPLRAEPWFAVGLAAARMNNFSVASAAFDTALSRLTPNERIHYTSFHRLVPPRATERATLLPDSVSLAKSDSATRAHSESLYWFVNNPRGGRAYNEARLEYIARVVQADLLFDSEDYNLRGADSDRGLVLIRYGPPDEQYIIDNSRRDASARDFFQRESMDGGLLVVWIYRNDLTFVFGMAPTFGTAYSSMFDKVAVDSIREERPSSWDNIKSMQRTVPMLSHAARFRSEHHDSMDVVIAAAIPTLALLAGSELGGELPIEVQLSVHDAEARIVGTETMHPKVRGEQLPTVINAWWQRRLARASNMVRIDAEQTDVERSALALTPVHAIPRIGPALSDILFARAPQPRSGIMATRWSDMSLQPVVPVFSTTEPVSLVWENYELGNENGSARYRVTLELERTFKTSMRGLGARIVANFRNIVEGGNNGTGALQMSFEQVRPHSSAIVDYISINLTESVTGPYRLSITVADLVTGRVQRTTSTFELGK